MGGGVSQNHSQNRDPIDGSAEKTLPARFGAALALLLDAFEYAEQTNGDRWEFAVEIHELHEAGLTKNDLRFLVRQQFVEHATEVTILGHDGRQFQSTGDLTFTERTCIVLTISGVVAAIESCKGRSEKNAKSSLVVRALAEWNTASTPAWDPERRVLSLDGRIVKHFKWPAVNQEAILAAFEEERWCSRIDDPLPPQPGQDPKRRLSDTIKCLNRKQASLLIHFRGDGTGEGVVWEFIRPDSKSNGTE